jgi:WXG100 family type VII secretion target
MRGIASQFGNKAEALDALISEMDGLTQQLVAGWEGSASVGYQNRFNTIKTNFQTQMRPLVDEIIQNLNTVANEMEAFDSEIGAKFG